MIDMKIPEFLNPRSYGRKMELDGKIAQGYQALIGMAETAQPPPAGQYVSMFSLDPGCALPLVDHRK